MTGRSRTCDASRFRRALYRAELRSHVCWNHAPGRVADNGHAKALRSSCGPEGDAFRDLPRRRRGSKRQDSARRNPARGLTQWARLGSNQQPLVCETSALPLSYSPASSAREPRGRTTVQLRPAKRDAFRDLPRRRRGSERRESARRIPAREQAPGQGVEPRSPRSERGVLPVRRSRKGRRLHPRPRAGTSMQLRTTPCSLASSVSPAHEPNDVVQATRLPFDPGSPTAGCAIRMVAVLRGGALEPEPRARSRKSAGKSRS